MNRTTTTRKQPFKPLVVLQVVNNGDGTYSVLSRPRAIAQNVTWAEAILTVAEWLDVEQDVAP